MNDLPNIEQLQDKYALEEDRSEDYINWATEMLQAGNESPLLVHLAGLDLEPIDSEEVEVCFSRCTKELGLHWPDRNEAKRQYQKKLAEQILNGQRDPFVVLTELARLYPHVISDESLSEIWFNVDVDLFGGDGPIFSSASADLEPAEYIKAEAQLFIDLLQIDLPSDFLNKYICESCGNFGYAGDIWKPGSKLLAFAKRIFSIRSFTMTCKVCGAKEILSMGSYEGRKAYLDAYNQGRLN